MSKCRRPFYRCVYLMMYLALPGILLACHSLPHKEAREARSIQAGAYEVSIHNDGRISVLLRSGETVFDKVQSKVWLESQSQPVPVRHRGVASMRGIVDDALGRGQGVTLVRGGHEWHLRVYPASPYMTSQITYTNTSKQPVYVKALLPWNVDAKSSGFVSMGTGGQNSLVLTLGEDGDPVISQRGSTHGKTLLAAWNPDANRTMVAGFLTNDEAESEVLIGSPVDPGLFGTFGAICIYDPPVRLEPDERLTSEVFYLAPADTDPFSALETYAGCMAALSRTDRKLPIPPHGWRTSSNPSTAEVMHIAEMAGQDLVHSGWRTITVRAGWETEPGSWTPHPTRFPDGFRTLNDHLAHMGLRASLCVTPSVPDTRLLREYFERIRKEWGFQAVEIDLSPLWMYEEERTFLERRRDTLLLLREAMGNDAFIVERSPAVLRGLGANGSASMEQTSGYNPGRFFLRAATGMPLVVSPTPIQLDMLQLGALTGAVLQIEGDPSSLREEERQALSRLLPVLHRPARALDLFIQPEMPTVWSTTIMETGYEWAILAFTNPEPGNDRTHSVLLQQIGLTAPHYTVFDFWNSQYHGVASGELHVNTPAGTTQVFGLRPYRTVPMILATDNHFAMGAYEIEGTRWVSDTACLQGQMKTAKDRIHTLIVLSPSPYTLETIHGFGDDPHIERHLTASGEVLRIEFVADQEGTTPWELLFSQTE